MIPTNYNETKKYLSGYLTRRLKDCGRATIVHRIFVPDNAPTFQVTYRHDTILTWLPDGVRVLHSPTKLTAGYVQRLRMLCPDIVFHKIGYGMKITGIRINYQGKSYTLKCTDIDILLAAANTSSASPSITVPPVFDQTMIQERLSWLPSSKRADAQLLMDFAQQHIVKISYDSYKYSSTRSCPYCVTYDGNGSNLGRLIGMTHLRTHMERFIDGPDLLLQALGECNNYDLLNAHTNLYSCGKSPSVSIQQKWYPIFVLYLWKYGKLYGE